MSVHDALNEFQPVAGPGDGRDLLINCPNCGTRGARAVCYDLIETYKVVIKHRTTWVTCSACGYKLYSKVPADQLRGRSAQELEGIVVRRVSLISKFFAIVAILLCILPIMGLILAIIATILNWKNRGWLRKVSLVALVISGLITAAFAVLSAIFPGDDDHMPRQPPPPAMVWVLAR